MNMRYAVVVLVILLAGCSASHTTNPTVPAISQPATESRAVPHAIATIPPVALVEYRIPTANSQPYFITPAGDGNLWFGENKTVKIGRITTGGVITEFSAGGSTALTHIGTGPDGHPWFGAVGPDAIGRVAYDGSVQLYPMPTPGGSPEQLVGDIARNAVWFPERVAHKICEFSLATQTFSEFAIPPPTGGFPVLMYAIALDRAGNVWFGDANNDQVDEMSGTGNILQRLTLPGTTGQQSLYPYRMTLGSDGDLWVTEITGGTYFHGGVARINPSTSSITTYTPPSSRTHNDSTYDVVSVSDGVWVSEPGLPGIAHIRSSNGQIKEYTTVVPAIGGTQPVGITVGLDNNIWYVDYLKNSIARVNVTLLP